MLCCKPLMDVTRRQVLGLGVVALGALRLSSPAFAATSGPDLFELALDDPAARAAERTLAHDQGDRGAAPLRPGRAALGRAARSFRPRSARAPAGGRWTRWTALPPSHGAGVPGTDPAFTGAADELQLRLRGGARGLQPQIRARAPARAHAPRARASQAGAPYIVPRDSWGADQVPPRSGPSYGTVQAAFVHHTAGTIEYAPEDSPGIVLGIARYHRDSNGWNDIGYNFLVDRYGVIFEGRAGGIDAAVIGAQAQGYNSQSTGIATLGTFTNLPLDEPAMEALAKLIGWKLSIHGIPTQGTVTLISGGGQTNRYPNGTPVLFERISAHRDSNETTCPGDALYAQLPDLRARAARYAVPISAITVRASSQRGTKRRSPSPASCASPTAPPPPARALARRVHDRRRGLDARHHDRRRPRRRLGGERRAPGHRARPRGVRRRRRSRRLESAPISVRVVPSMTLTTRQAPREDRHGVRDLRHARARAAARRLPARAPGPRPLGAPSSASGSTRTAAATRPRSARSAPGSTASRSSPTASPAGGRCARSANRGPMTPRQDPTAAARNEAFFADNAAYTERVASLDTYRFIREHLDAEVAGAQRLLDIGNGGTFDYDPALAGAITAVDLFVEPGAERPPNVEYVQGDALDLPVEDGSYDTALMVMLFHHLVGASARDLLGERQRVAGGGAPRARSGRTPDRRRSCVAPWFYAFERVAFGALLAISQARRDQASRDPAAAAAADRGADRGALRGRRARAANPGRQADPAVRPPLADGAHPGPAVDLHRASLRKLRRQGAIFASVGVIVLVVYTGLTALLAGPVGLPFQIALALSYGTALALNFTLHRTFTFASDSGYALRLPGQIARFLALALFQYVVTALAIALLPDALGLPEFAVWAIVMATFAIGNFLALRLTTFHYGRRCSRSPSTWSSAAPPTRASSRAWRSPPGSATSTSSRWSTPAGSC